MKRRISRPDLDQVNSRSGLGGWEAIEQIDNPEHFADKGTAQEEKEERCKLGFELGKGGGILLFIMPVCSLTHLAQTSQTPSALRK